MKLFLPTFRGNQFKLEKIDAANQTLDATTTTFVPRDTRSDDKL